MNKIRPFIPKKSPELPDAFGLTVYTVDGAEHELEVVSAKVVSQCGIFELLTKTDEWVVFPLTSILQYRYDKRFSKIIAEKERKAHEKAAK